MTYTFCQTDVPLHHLKLKRSAPVMIIRNILHPDIGNGKIYVVIRNTKRVVHIASVDLYCLQRDAFPLRGIEFPFSFHGFIVTRTQFPTRLAFAGTVHKVQGQTLNKFIVDLRSNSFLRDNSTSRYLVLQYLLTFCFFTIIAFSDKHSRNSQHACGSVQRIIERGSYIC